MLGHVRRCHREEANGIQASIPRQEGATDLEDLEESLELEVMCLGSRTGHDLRSNRLHARRLSAGELCISLARLLARASQDCRRHVRGFSCSEGSLKPFQSPVQQHSPLMSVQMPLVPTEACAQRRPVASVMEKRPLGHDPVAKTQYD